MRRAWLALPLSIATVALAAGCLGDRRRQAELPSGGAIPFRPPTRDLQVQAARNDSTFFVRVRFPSNEGTRQEYFHRTGGAWRLEGGGFRDLQAALDGDPARGDATRSSAISEVALSLLLDDPGTPAGLRDHHTLGCFGLCHERQRQMPNWRAEDGASPMRVWPGFGGWADLWVWRAHRTGLAGWADDLSIRAAGIVPDAGTAPFTTLALDSSGMPPFVFDPATTAGGFAASWADIASGDPSPFGDGTLAMPVAMTLGSALAAGWIPADGDAVPAQRLSRATGSRADVTAAASWNAGAVTGSGEWDVVLSRTLVSSDTGADITLTPGRPYRISFSLHADDADGRDHYVSLPLFLLLDTSGVGIPVPALAGAAAPDFTDEGTHPISLVSLFLPGVTSFEFLVGATADRTGAPREDDVKHGGNAEVSASAKRCADCHRIRGADPAPPFLDAGPLEELVLRRGGVYGPTPWFEPEGP